MLTFDAAEHRYCFNGSSVPGVTRVLEAAGLYSFGNASPEDLAFTRQRGTAIHVATALDDLDDLNEASVDPAIAGFVEGWRLFRRECDFVPLAIEELVFHPVYRYAGTRDRRGFCGMLQSLVILDIKHGSKQRATGPQLAAYHATLSKAEQHTHRRLAVYLQEDGRYRLEPHTDRNDFAVFVAALTLFNFKGLKP